MEYNFKKVHTGKDLTISSIILIAGIGLFFVNKTAGICIAACGLLMLFFYKSAYRIDGKGTAFTHKSVCLCRGCRSSILDYFNGKDVTPEIKEGDEGGSIRLDTYFNKAEGIAYARLFAFRNFAYEPETEIVELNGERAEKLITRL